jgi:hypothetical protein
MKGMDLRAGQRSIGIGIAASAVAIALVTVPIYGLREVMPVAGAGVLYLLPVLLASTGWGLWLGVGTAVASPSARTSWWRGSAQPCGGSRPRPRMSRW